jgi:NADPH-dependent curcumin reductase CurA
MARLRSTDSVLIHAAAGGVGTAAVQLAKHFGCTVFGTAGNDEKIKLLSNLNIDGAINYRTQDFENKMEKALMSSWR